MSERKIRHPSLPETITGKLTGFRRLPDGRYEIAVPVRQFQDDPLTIITGLYDLTGFSPVDGPTLELRSFTEKTCWPFPRIH